MSAARAAARAKPVVVVKSGRHRQGAKAARPNRRTRRLRRGLRRGVPAGGPPARHRSRRTVRGGGNPGQVTAVSGQAACRPDQWRRHRRARRRPAHRSRRRAGRDLARRDAAARRGAAADLVTRNPVDIVGDADGARYAAAFEALLDDPGNDAVLVHECADRACFPRRPPPGGCRGPQASRQKGCAQAGIRGLGRRQRRRDGEFRARRHLRLMRPNRMRSRGFMHLVRYREAQKALMATPPSLPADFSPDLGAARTIIEGALAAGQTSGSTRSRSRGSSPPTPSRWRLPCWRATPTRPRRGGAVAAGRIDRGGQDLSPDIVHKSEVGGVRLNLTSELAVREAVAQILARARGKPQARITGVTIHPMILRPKARELIAGIADDPTFGPVIVFGRGGTAVEVINDKALALPPLDLKLAHELMARTRVSRILKAYRDVPAVDEPRSRWCSSSSRSWRPTSRGARGRSQSVSGRRSGLVAVDTRIAVAPLDVTRPGPSGHPRFAIRPYPKEWESSPARSRRREGHVFVRPLRPEDEPLGAARISRPRHGGRPAVLSAHQRVRPRLPCPPDAA